MNTGIHDFKELNQKFMNKSEKEIIKQIPDATDRKRVKEYNYREYYGDIEYPDDPEFTVKTKNDAWIIILINVIFIGGLIACAAFFASKL